MTAAAKKAAAARQRLARARRRASELVVSVTVNVDMSTELIALGLLHPHRDDDRDAIGRALGDLLRRHLDRVTRDGG